MHEGPLRILATLPDLAWPTHSGKRRRLESVVRGLSEVGRLDVAVLFADTDPGASPVPPGVAVERWGYLPSATRAPALAAAHSLGRGLPWQIAVRPWGAVPDLVRGWGPPYDLVWFGCLDHAVMLGRQQWGQRILVDCDDVETAKLRRYLSVPAAGRAAAFDRAQRRVELPMWARVQRQVLQRAERVFVCSEVDRDRLAGSGPVEKIWVLPNTYPDVEPVRPAPAGPCTVVMIADYANEANADAARLAAREVLPLLQARQPGAVIRLIGRKMELLADLAAVPGIELVGEIADERVAFHLADAHAVLVPLRFAGGTRLKIIEAFAYGVPVVSTTAGAEGLDVVDGAHALLADNPAALAAAVDRVVSEPELAARLRRSGRELYEAHYRPEAAATVVAAAVREGLLRTSLR